MNREHGAGKTSVSSVIAAGRGTPGRPGVSPACARSAHKKMPARRRRTQGLRDMRASAMRIRVSAFAEATRRKHSQRVAP